MRLSIKLLLCVFWLHIFWGHAQNDSNYVIDFITVKEGLSHNYATSIVSDSQNLKWIGTENGITHYNGYDFEYIKPGKDYKGLLNENIEVLFTDADSNIWIGTKSGGLSYYNVKTNELKSFNELIDFSQEGDIRVTSIAQDNENQIWVGTWKNGVFVIDFKDNVLKKHFDYNEQVYSIKKDTQGFMWFCSGFNLYKYVTGENLLENFEFNAQVNDILPDKSRERIWISTSGINDKLYYYDVVTKRINSIETGVRSNFSKRLLLDNKNRIWIGTWGRGVYRSNADLSSFDKINLVDNSKDKISGNYNTILSIHQDKNNIIWLSTASGGIVKLFEGNGFKNLSDFDLNNNLKSSLNCTSIHKSGEKLFLGTLYSGVYYGKDYSSLKKIEAIPVLKINGFYEYRSKLYIGTAKGFYIYDLVSDRIVKQSKIKNKVTSFYISSDDEVFIGTQQNGIILTTINTIDKPNTYIHYKEDLDEPYKIESDRITEIKPDNYNNIWVSGYNGMHVFNRKTKSFIHQSELLEAKLSTNIINGFSVQKENLWLATPNGLVKLKYKDKNLFLEKIINKEDGLKSDFICALTFDAFDNIWLSTQTEIIKYKDDNSSFISYGEKSGIKASLFNNNTFYNDDKKILFFGGIDDVTFFRPKDVNTFQVQPEVVFTSLNIKNEYRNYEIDREENYLDKSINYASLIRLGYKDDFFSTRFVANDFMGKTNIHYRYRLDGYQKEWINLHSMNELNFTGLSPGEYQLQVQASRDNQNWSPSKSIDIILENSPWKTPLAYIIYFSTLLFIVIYLIRYNNKRIKLENSLNIERIEQEKKVELANSKLNFFTNISHEFRTPLTLIVSPIKELLQFKDLPKAVYTKLSYVDKNTNRLLNLVNQILDFRKAEYGILKLTASYGNFVNFAHEVYLYFKESAKAKNITYNFNTSQKELNFPFDRNKMEIVLCNLLSNAIKFTDYGGQIDFNISKGKHQNCIISIKDDGIGIKNKDINKIFDKFYQIKDSNSAKMVGSGIGLTFSKNIIELHHGEINVKSKKNKGTEFIICISTDAEKYKGEIDESFKKTDNISAYDDLKPKNPKTLKPKTTKPNVLIIDDNPDILNYLSEILAGTYEVHKADDGDKGVKAALKHSPDLIISDVMMPKKDGITLCRELKTNINTSHIPIILLTARTSTVYEIEGLEHGADDYITKPFKADVVLARISSQLENRHKVKSYFLNKIRFEPSSTEINEGQSSEDKFVEKAIQLVEDNLENPEFGIETMLEDLGMSRSSLFRKIKSLTGLSLSAFIRSIRVKRAAHLILTENISLKEVAFEVGFNTYKYFKQSFQEQYGCLPSKYKEKMSENH